MDLESKSYGDGGKGVSPCAVGSKDGRGNSISQEIYATSRGWEDLGYVFSLEFLEVLGTKYKCLISNIKKY